MATRYNKGERPYLYNKLASTVLQKLRQYFFKKKGIVPRIAKIAGVRETHLITAMGGAHVSTMGTFLNLISAGGLTVIISDKLNPVREEYYVNHATKRSFSLTAVPMKIQIDENVEFHLNQAHYEIHELIGNERVHVALIEDPDGFRSFAKKYAESNK